MKKFSIKRLIVMDHEKMVGVISSRDIVTITPALRESIIEKARITQPPLIREKSSTDYCDQCGQWSNTLVSLASKFM